MPRTFPMRTYLTTLGAIRCGTSTPGRTKDGRPTKVPQRLDTFRLTSQDKPAILKAADLYGGEVLPWKGAGGIDQWQVVTTSNTLRIVVQGTESIQEGYEIWDGETLLQRCNGTCILHAAAMERIGLECVCDDSSESACKLVIRLACTLPDIAPYGLWRVASHGKNATADLLGTRRYLQARGMPGDEHFEAILRLEARRSGGRTVRVPVLALSGETMQWRAATTQTRVTTVAEALSAAEDVYGESDHLETPIVHVAPEEPMLSRPPTPVDRSEDYAIIARIDALVTGNGGNLISFWARNCSAQVVDRPEHLTRSQLLALEEHVQRSAAQRGAPAKAQEPDDDEAWLAAAERGEDEIPF